MLSHFRQLKQYSCIVSKSRSCLATIVTWRYKFCSKKTNGDQRTIALSTKPKNYSIVDKSKVSSKNETIDIKYHFIRDKVEKKELVLEYCSTEQMLADLLTKQLGKTLFQRLRGLMGVRDSL